MEEPVQQWVTGDGSFGEIDAAPQEVRDVISAKGWKSVGDVVSGYSNLEAKLGSEIRLPETLEGDHLKTVWSKLGVPESVDGYEYTAPEGSAIDDNLLNGFKEFAHQQNMPAGMFNEVVNFQLEAAAESQKLYEEQIEQQKTDAAEALKQEWKDNYDVNFKSAKETSEKLEILEDLEGLGLADHPNVIKMLNKISSKLSEDTLSPKTASPAVDKSAEMQSIIDSDAFKDRMHPEHGATIQRFHSLCREKAG